MSVANYSTESASNDELTIEYNCIECDEVFDDENNLKIHSRKHLM